MHLGRNRRWVPLWSDPTLALLATRGPYVSPLLVSQDVINV